MPVQFEFKIIGGKPFKPDKVRLELLNALRKQGRKVNKDFQKTTVTWKGERPTFEFEISLAKGNAALFFVLSGPSKGRKKWRWLNEGTKVRHAVMDKKFRPKTSPNVLRAGSGAGPRHPVHVSKAVKRPGIQKRNWSFIILATHESPFQFAMRRAVIRGLRKSIPR